MKRKVYVQFWLETSAQTKEQDLKNLNDCEDLKIIFKKTGEELITGYFPQDAEKFFNREFK